MYEDRRLGPAIKMEEARKVVEAMVEAATKDGGEPMTFAVVDTGGVLVYFARMNGSTSRSTRMSTNKAFTSIDTRRDTIVERAVHKERGSKVSEFGDPRLTDIPGGVLLRGKDGCIVGAVGTSGRDAEGDEKLARIGAKAYMDG